MSGLGSTGLKRLSIIEEQLLEIVNVMTGQTQRVTQVEATVDDALRGAQEALDALAGAGERVGELELRVGALEARVFGAEIPEPEDPEEPEPPEPPPGPFSAVLQPETWVSSPAFRVHDGYVETVVGANYADITDGRPVSLKPGEYHLWARVYAPGPHADAFVIGVIDNGTIRSRRVFPKEHGKWEVVPAGSVAVTGTQPTFGIGPAEVGCAIDVIVLHDGYLTVEEVKALMGPAPAAPPPQEPPPPPPPPVIEEPGKPEPVVRLPGFTPNPDFDPDKPVINGKLLEGEALRAWQGIRWLIDNYRSKAYTEDGAIDRLAVRDSVYHYGRHKAMSDNDLLGVYALSGWLGALDELTRTFKLQYSMLKAGYRTWWAKYDASKVKHPEAPYLSWSWDMTSDDKYIGTSYHEQDSAKAHTPLLRYIDALQRARGVASPAGYDYGEEADKWVDYLRSHFLPLWRGAEEIGNPGWAKNHKGLLHRYYKPGHPDTERAGVAGLPRLPVLSRHHVHSHISSSVMHYYLGKVLPEEGEATAIGEQGIRDLALWRNVFYWEGKYGRTGVMPRSLQGTGHGSIAEPSGAYVFPVTYYRYPISDLTLAKLDGWLPEYGDAFGRPAARLLAEYAVPNTPEGKGFPGDVTNNTTVAGKNQDGERLLIPGAHTYTGDFGTPRSASNVVATAYPYLLPFDPDGSLRAHFERLMRSSSAFSDSRATDVMERPRVLAYNLGVLMANVGGLWT